ncbi:White colony protein whs11 [Yamadazyma tenuis]|nr:White colony protein whs11 [Yamadazyma tenuis]
MSDIGRKNISDKIESKITPDSQKSGFQQAKDKVTDTADDVVGGNTASDGKSWTQQASDAVFGEKK